ncbi:hypothetical protein FITA111629_05260 [Filibacter tadaridae]|uniref:Uncharacterized protein n=1 Tax=Filibacter tadaridae TaxID=2483811 RepID=A0A3P5WY08_9BACL|nr:hypothetical protein FILTAD_00934 [Filibacter tadaridae]
MYWEIQKIVNTRNGLGIATGEMNCQNPERKFQLKVEIPKWFAIIDREFE